LEYNIGNNLGDYFRNFLDLETTLHLK
jgi:hypothetical protein